MDHIAQLQILTLAAGTPLVYAALGELVTEKAGVLNLGVEGMMLVGAVVAFIVAATTKSPWLGVLAGMLAGAALSLIFAFVTLTLQANQVASGLALSLFGIGLSAFIGLEYVSVVIEPINPSNGDILGRVQASSESDYETILERANHGKANAPEGLHFYMHLP